MSALELCGRCGKTVVFEDSLPEPTCPDCGWGRKAGAAFAKKAQADLRRGRLLRRLKYGAGGLAVVVSTLIVLSSPLHRERVIGKVYGLIGLSMLVAVPFFGWIAIQWYLDKSRAPRDRYFADSTIPAEKKRDAS